MSEESQLSKLDARLAVVETVLGGLPLKGEKGLVHISKQLVEDMDELRTLFNNRVAGQDKQIEEVVQTIRDVKNQAKGARFVFMLLWALIGFATAIVLDIVKVHH